MFPFGSARLAKSGATQAEDSWTAATPPSAASAAVNRYRHRRRQLPPPSTAVDRYRRRCQSLPPQPTMVNPGPPRPPRLVAEALGTRSILAKLAAILTDHSRTVREDGAALTPEKRSGRGIHTFLAQLASGVDPVPGLEQETVVRVYPDRRVHLMLSIFSVQFDLYLTQRRLFACLGELPAKVLPPVVEIPEKDFTTRRSVCAVPRVDQVTHIGRTSPPDWKTKPCERAVKTSGTEYVDLA